MTDAAPQLEQVPPEDIVWVNGFATPPSPPVRLFHALTSVLKLIANKEDTRQVFEAIQALAGHSGKRLFERFTATPYGRRVVSEPVKLEAILGDREALRAMPEGSLARVYLDFMEGEDLTPEGLLGAAEEAGIDLRAETQFEEYRRMFLHLDVSHDLWHVLTGYGRDALGEICNLVYTYGQTRNSGFKLIIWVGFLAQKLERPGAPIVKALKEAKRNSRDAAWVMEHDVEELLPLPLEEVRRRLKINEPAVYNGVPDEVKNGLLKPKVKKTQSERENLRDAQPAS